MYDLNTSLRRSREFHSEHAALSIICDVADIEPMVMNQAIHRIEFSPGRSPGLTSHESPPWKWDAECSSGSLSADAPNVDLQVAYSADQWERVVCTVDCYPRSDARGPCDAEATGGDSRHAAGNLTGSVRPGVVVNAIRAIRELPTFSRPAEQQALAELTGISLIQIHRYENSGSQPSLEALRKLATGLSVSADTLVFEDSERGPDELKLQFEAVSQFDADEKQIVKALLDSLILKHQARRWATPA